MADGVSGKIGARALFGSMPVQVSALGAAARAESDAARYAFELAAAAMDLAKQQQGPGPIIKMPDNPPLEEIATPELVMELIKRGFAVAKCPEPGQMPEALCGPADTE